MKDELKQAITSLTKKAESAKTGIESQQYSQAAMNLTNALLTIKTHELE